MAIICLLSECSWGPWKLWITEKWSKVLQDVTSFRRRQWLHMRNCSCYASDASVFLAWLFLHSKAIKLTECQSFKADTAQWITALVWFGSFEPSITFFVNCHVFAVISWISTTIKYPDCQNAPWVNDSDLQFYHRERMCMWVCVCVLTCFSLLSRKPNKDLLSVNSRAHSDCAADIFSWLLSCI